MARLIAGADLRSAHERLMADGRLGERLQIEIGAGMAEIKRRRRVFEHPSVTTQVPKAPRPAKPKRAEMDAMIEAQEAENEDFTNPDVLNQRLAAGFEMLMDNRDQQALARASLDGQARPLAGKREPEGAEQPGKPTPELTARYGGEEAFDISVTGKGEKAPIRQYTVKGPLDSYVALIPQHIREALSRFAKDAEVSGITSVTANYEGFSSAGRGPRAGGLGNVEQEVRVAFWRHEKRMQMLEARLDTQDDMVAAATILGWAVLLERFGDGQVPSLAAIGKRLCPDRDDERYLRGEAIGAIKMIGRALICIEHDMQEANLRINGGPGIERPGVVNRRFAEVKIRRGR